MKKEAKTEELVQQIASLREKAIESLQEKRKKFKRPSTSVANYSSVNPQSCKNHNRDMSESFAFCTSRNKYQDDSRTREQSMTKEDFMNMTMNNTTLNGISMAKYKANPMSMIRRSCDQLQFKSFHQNDSITDLHELRNRTKMSRQRKDGSSF